MRRRSSLPVTFLVPTLAVLLVLSMVPTFYAIVIALQNRELSSSGYSWVWFSNFIDLFLDRRFLNAVWVSVKWEIVTVAATMREIGPFGGQRALRAGERAGRLPGQEIREVEQVAGFIPSARQVALQPHQLRRLHFRRHHPTDVVEHGMAAFRAFIGFGNGAVVEPDDGVPAPLAGDRHAELAALPVAHHQRAGGVEGDADNILRRNAGLFARGAHGLADCRPDIRGIMASTWSWVT